jgi:hypothetical protein
MQIRGVLVLVGMVLGGCGGMMIDIGGMHDAVADATTENEAHLSATLPATTMPAMLGEVTRHASRMGEILDDMSTHLGTMTHCSRASSMMDLRDEMHAELDAHGATMNAVANLDEAHAEVAHHVVAMGTMLHDMDRMVDGMRCSGW